MRGKRVLCLAGGGGQQSAVFALLGAKVTVLDLSVEQLERDREAARHYGVEVERVQGDMRDLSGLGAEAFDIVWHPYSINFVPDARAVFGQVARVVRVGGLYHFNCANPFSAGLSEADWNGTGYSLRLPYQDGAVVSYPDSEWVHASDEAVPPPREFRHTMSTLLNGLLEAGFRLRRFSDTADYTPDAGAEPGSDEHLTAYAPPWLAFWATRDG